MTDTAKAKSIVKPLVWASFRTEYGHGIDAETPEGDGRYIAVQREAGLYCAEFDKHFETEEAVKAACQADYEACILSALDLTAYRKEVLESVTRLLRRIADNSQLSGQSKIKCDAYRQAANVISKKAYRALAEQGSE